MNDNRWKVDCLVPIWLSWVTLQLISGKMIGQEVCDKDCVKVCSNGLMQHGVFNAACGAFNAACGCLMQHVGCLMQHVGV